MTTQSKMVPASGGWMVPSVQCIFFYGLWGFLSKYAQVKRPANSDFWRKSAKGTEYQFGRFYIDADGRARLCSADTAVADVGDVLLKRQYITVQTREMVSPYGKLPKERWPHADEWSLLWKFDDSTTLSSISMFFPSWSSPPPLAMEWVVVQHQAESLMTLEAHMQWLLVGPGFMQLQVLLESHDTVPSHCQIVADC